MISAFLNKTTLLAIFGFLLGGAANCMLLAFWSRSLGSFMDCPNYVFDSYAILPLPFIFIPLLLASCGLGIFTCLLALSWRNKSRRATVVNALGLLVNTVPFVVTIILPLLSDWLGQTTPGC